MEYLDSRYVAHILPMYERAFSFYKARQELIKQLQEEDDD